MAILYKCKMCGGTLELHNNETVAACEYCGTQQTLPRLDNDRRANLYDRANHFRRNNDFDKAMGIYEQILNDDPTDAEAYWSIVLCRYGIEYVEDPATHKRVPTVNRAQFTSIFDDDNYKSALQYADESQRSIYEDEAQAINEIQKGILAISQKEEPFDVFICYKETDNNGRRTPDSVLANDLYHQLTLEGFKVFFSRITLEDKLGVAYEPYIFAALNSAKVMVVLGTKPEHFNAVWVKNEWSRYLSLIKNGAKKILIPAYKDMDPYDLPEEFSHLQAQDMSKLGFMQDLIRGIKKLTETEPINTKKAEPVAVPQSTAAPSGNIGALLERGKMALEDNDWKKADGFFEEVLNQDAKNADAYLGKALAAERCATLAELVQERLGETEQAEYQVFPITTAPERAKAAVEQYTIPEYLSAATIDGFYDQKPVFSDCVADRKAQRSDEEQYWTEHKALSRALRFATADSADGIKDVYTTLLKKMDERIAEAEKESIANKTKVEKDYARFLDEADAKAQKQYEVACAHREKDYQDLCLQMEGSLDGNGYKHISHDFSKLLDYKDSKARVQMCMDKAAAWQTEQKALAERKAAATRAKVKKISIIAAAAALLIVAVTLLTTLVIIPNTIRSNYVKLLGQVSVGDYIEFGEYEQDNNTSNGMESIEWLVLEAQEDRILVISKYIIDAQPFNKDNSLVTWESCTLRSWLNNDFIDVAFSRAEQSMIPTVNIVVNDRNNSDSKTQDKLYILDLTESNKYFNSESERLCKPTNYAVEKGAYVNGYGYGWWRLRSLANAKSYTFSVGADGQFYYYTSGSDNHVGVRPVFWIDRNP